MSERTEKAFNELMDSLYIRGESKARIRDFVNAANREDFIHLESHLREKEKDLTAKDLKVERVIAEVADLKSKLAASEERVKELEAENLVKTKALELILPMAKGYAANHPVGSNQKYIDISEQALSQHPSELMEDLRKAREALHNFTRLIENHEPKIYRLTEVREI